MSAGDEKPGTHSKRPRALTVVLVVITAGMIVLSITLAVMFTVPLKSVERTETAWFGARLVTQSVSQELLPFRAVYSNLSDYACQRSNANGNQTLSIEWNSTSADTTAYIIWVSGSIPSITAHIVYWANNTSWGGYTVPPGVASVLCHYPPVFFNWFTPVAAVITLSGLLEYNYTTTAPIW